MFALLEHCVTNLAQQAGVMAQGADIASVDLVGVYVEMGVAQGLQTVQHRVDLELGSREGVEGFGIHGEAADGHGEVSSGELHR
jgi:hypothetical protein